jgi:hypothetical protein
MSTFLSSIFVLKKGKMVCEVAPHVVFLNHVELGLSEPKTKKEKKRKLNMIYIKNVGL